MTGKHELKTTSRQLIIDLKYIKLYKCVLYGVSCEHAVLAALTSYDLLLHR